MKRIPFAALLLLALFCVVAAAQTPTPAAKLKIGDMAPDFTLTDTAGQKVKLSDFRGKNNVVLAFYIFAFTGG
jgi:cytochrome oxidase Cu insertion factor (SCO1/SenC/PrrC family)